MQSAQQSKCDIVYLAHGRPEFTRASLAALVLNTDWSRVSRLVIYTDGDADFATAPGTTLPCFDFLSTRYGGPVAIMNAYLADRPAEIWAKIDNDVIVPPDWLGKCLDVMDARPELDLLGIEPPLSRTPAPWANGVRQPAPEHSEGATVRGWPVYNPTYARCHSIGGIGLFRTRAWKNRDQMKPFAAGRGGFSDWQVRNGKQQPYSVDSLVLLQEPLRIGWIVPPLNLFLLDRLPFEPWRTLSLKYMAEGSQRAWTNYSQAEAQELAGWWLSSGQGAKIPTCETVSDDGSQQPITS